MIKKLSHLGHVTRNVDQVVQAYQQVFGVRPVADITLKEAGQRSVFIPIGNQYIEVWTPLEAGSPAAKTLEARGEGLSHIAFLVDDPVASVKTINGGGGKAWEAPAAPGITTAFVHPKSTGGVLVELVDERLLPALFALGKR